MACGPDSKERLRDILVYTADQEIHIEKLRQSLC